jgi:hypothetical protein
LKKIFLAFVLVTCLFLIACGETTTEDLGGSVTNNDNTTGEQTNNDTDSNSDEGDGESESEQSINQLIVDNEHYKATLISITKKEDSIFGNSYEVLFDIENRRSDTIVAQAREVSADGRMIDETILSMSDEIAPGKKGYAKLTISEYEGYDFPEITSDFEMILHVFSWDDYDWVDDNRVQVSF